MLDCANEGDRKVQAEAVLEKQPRIQRCEKANGRMVQLLREGKMEYSARVEGGFTYCEHFEEQPRRF